jgi:peptidoglycan/xylan/chitin deacetylase (PgdA/CDA1 family)/SAM-dependent methyltransferase
MSMPSEIATIVRCAGLVREVYTTILSIERQSCGHSDVVVVTDESTPATGRTWLEALASSRGFAFVHVPSTTPGAAKNAGARVSCSPLLTWIDAGDTFERDFHATALAVLRHQAGTDIVKAGSVVVGVDGARAIDLPGELDLQHLVVEGAAHDDGGLAVRRSAWVALGGFDESLPALDEYELCLRALSLHRRCAAIDRALLGRRQRKDSLRRQSWAEQEEAMRRIFRTHGSLFTQHLTALLCTPGGGLPALRARKEALLSRRQAAIDQDEALGARWRQLQPTAPPDGGVEFGDFRRTSPVARDWGTSRGTPIDRFYIERFLGENARDIRGAVLEVQEAVYTVRFGGDRVTRSDVVDLDPGNHGADIVTDLRAAANVPGESYDCVVLTQTLHVVDEPQAVIAECARVLRPGGVLLATLPCVSRVCVEYGLGGDFWRVTADGARRLFAGAFPAEATEVRSHGNVLVALAFLHGLACSEITESEFRVTDPYYPLLVTVRAVKPNPRASVARAPLNAAGTTSQREGSIRGATGREALSGAAILLYHRVGVPQNDVHGLVVPPEVFRAQMRHLSEHYQLMSLDELAASLRRGRVPTRGVAVCFDDGYADNLTTASPTLLEYGIPATFFVVGDPMSDHRAFWWDVLAEVLMQPGRALPSRLRMQLPGGWHEFPTDTPAQRSAAHWEIHRLLAAARCAPRDEAIAALERWSGRGSPPAAGSRRMTREELVALASRPGHAVGAHSLHHEMLPHLSWDEQRADVGQSKRLIESAIGLDVTAFAYPYGAFDEISVEAVRAAGFTVAVTCEARRVAPRGDTLRLPRLEVTPSAAADFENWLRGHLLIS